MFLYLLAVYSIAREMTQKAGLTNITFHDPNQGPDHRLPSEPTFNLITVNDALHDMTRPDLALKVNVHLVAASLGRV